MRKSDLINIINEQVRVASQIYEMAMDYDTEHRPHPSIEDKLQKGDTPLNKINFPTSKSTNQNFLEFLASERYKEVVQKVKHYLGNELRFNLKGEERFTELTAKMFESSDTIRDYESKHKKQLEQLAIQVAIDYFQIPDNVCNWEVNLLVGDEKIKMDDFTIEKGNQINPKAVELEQELFTELEDLTLEKAKRRFINAITHGVAEKGHYIFNLLDDKLKQITGTDQLPKLYGIMMSVNDAYYWQLGDETLDSKYEKPGFSPAGVEDVDPPAENGNGLPTIKVQGINFVVLVHECLKGYMELLSMFGLPKDATGEIDMDKWEKISQSEDTLNKEAWDIRLGPKIWERIHQMFPDETVLQDNLPTIQTYFLKSVYSLPAKNFLVFMKEVLGQTQTGARLVREMIAGVEDIIKQQDYEEAMSIFQDDLDDVTDETTNDNLSDWLNSMGMRLSDDDEEDDDDGGELVPAE
jgi:hypothetical protein